MKTIIPEVGMGCTEVYAPDRRPYEITSVVCDGVILVREMDAKRTDKNGASPNQEYVYKSNAANATRRVVRQPNGEWREMLNGNVGNLFLLGKAEKYFDYGY